MRSRSIRMLVMASLLVAAVACAPPSGRDSAEIRTLAETWQASFNAGDRDAIAALYTDDARILPPNAPIGSGLDDVRAAFAEMLDAGLKIELETLEAVETGNVGHRIGTYAIRAGDALVDTGKFIEVWERQGGAWKIAADIWNSDLPAAPQRGTTLSVFHEVDDPARWLAAWSGEGSRHDLFARHGVNGVQVLQSPDNPKQTGLIIDVADMAALQAFLASPEGTKAKKADGVRDRTMRMLVEVPD